MSIIMQMQEMEWLCQITLDHSLLR
jgi:hypothetical protein